MVVPAILLAGVLSNMLPLTLAILAGYAVVLVGLLFAFLKSYTFLVRSLW